MWDGALQCGARTQERVVIGEVSEDGGKRLEGVKRHIRLATESKTVVVPGRGSNSTTS